MASSFLFEGECNRRSTCSCATGWIGSRCETMVNYCSNVTCQNREICRPLLLGYRCECLSDSYSGRHCEITATKIILYKMVSKSVAYIAIIFIICTAIFVVVMDILKYCFGIDPVEDERRRMQQETGGKKQKPVKQQSVYTKGLKRAQKKNPKRTVTTV